MSQTNPMNAPCPGCANGRQIRTRCCQIPGFGV